MIGAIAGVLLVALAIAELAARALERRLPPYQHWHDRLLTGKWHQVRALRREPPVDVVIAGGSQGLMAFDPFVVAPAPLRCYSAAFYRGIPKVVSRWLVDFVLPATRPRVVVWGLSIADLNDNGKLQREIDERFVANFRLRRDAVSRLRTWAVANSALVRRGPLLINPRRVLREVRAARVPTRAKPLSRLLGPMGKGLEYADFDAFQLTPEKAAFIHDELVANFYLGGEQVREIGRVADAARARGARLLLVELPTTEEFREMYPHGEADFTEARRVLSSLAAERGFEFVPVTQELPKHWFADCIHLNGVGMQKWSTMLSDRVASALGTAGRS